MIEMSCIDSLKAFFMQLCMYTPMLIFYQHYFLPVRSRACRGLNFLGIFDPLLSSVIDHRDLFDPDSQPEKFLALMPGVWIFLQLAVCGSNAIIQGQKYTCIRKQKPRLFCYTRNKVFYLSKLWFTFIKCFGHFLLKNSVGNCIFFIMASFFIKQ